MITKSHAMYNKHTIRLNASIFIILIGKREAAKLRKLKVNVER